jgi:hypothetical protein
VPFIVEKTASKGGTCIFVLNHLNFVKINIETHWAHFDIELCSIKIQSDSSSFIYILAVYRTPSGNFSFFSEQNG